MSKLHNTQLHMFQRSQEFILIVSCSLARHSDDYAGFQLLKEILSLSFLLMKKIIRKTNKIHANPPFLLVLHMLLLFKMACDNIVQSIRIQ